MNGCMNEWMDEWMNEWMDEWMNQWMNESMGEWLNKWMGQGWAKTQNLEKTQKTRVFWGFLGFSQGFFKCGFFQDVR